MTTQIGSHRLVFLDALRGIGAVGVALYHIHRYAPFRESLDSTLPNTLTQAFLHGWMGVPVFFVISGFVLAQSIATVDTSPTGQTRFMLRRAIRLGVPYWATLIVVLMLDAAARTIWGDETVTDPVSWQKLLANVVFLQDVLGFGNLTTGTWFVCVVLQLDLLFVVTLGLSHWLATRFSSDIKTSFSILTAILVPLGMLSLLRFNLDSQYDRWVIYFCCQPILGMLARWALERRLPAGVFWGYVLMMCGGIITNWRLEIALATAAGTTIYLVGRADRLGEWLSFRWLQYLGQISYSLFLIHYPVSWLVSSLGYRLTGNNAAAAVVWVVSSFLASLIAAHVLFVCVEKPSAKLASRRVMGGWGTRPASPAVAVES